MVGPIVTVSGAGEGGRTVTSGAAGGVSVYAQRLAWNQTAGMTPGSFTIYFKAEDAEKILKASTGNEMLVVRIQHKLLGFGTAVDVDFSVHNMLLIEPDRSVSPYETALTFADWRVALQGLRATGSYNVRRGTSEVDGLIEDANGTRSNDTGTGILKVGSAAKPPGGAVGDQIARAGAMARLFVRARQDYLEWTINEDGTPYTALQICRHLVQGAIDRTDPSYAIALQALVALRQALLQHSFDNRYTRSGVLIRGDSFPDTLDSWLDKAEVGIAPEVGRAGSFLAWWTGDDRPLDQVVRGMPPTLDGGGFLGATELKRVRAARVRVQFPKQVEAMLRLVGGDRLPNEPGGAEGEEDELPAVLQVRQDMQRRCYNVLKLPDSVEYLGVTWHKDTWVSVPFAFEMWANDPDVKKNLAALGVNPSVGLIRTAGTRGGDWSKIVREHWFPSQALAWMGNKIDGFGVQPNAAWVARMAAVRRHYLQTWMIDPALYRYVLEVKYQRARTISAVDGLPASPYVSVDHAEIYEFSVPEYPQLQASTAKAAENVAGVENPALAVGAPASLRQERPDVFSIDFDATYSGRWLQQVVPAKLVEDTIPPNVRFALLLNSGDPRIRKAWSTCQLEDPSLYQGFVILTLVFGTNAEPQRNAREGRWQQEALTHGVVVPAQAAGWPGEVNPGLAVEVAATEDVARFGLGDDLNVAAAPVNAIALEALATAHARRYYHGQRDRLRGRFTVPGWDPAYRLFGSLRSISTMLDASGTMSTTFDATSAPPPPDLHIVLPDAVRQAVFRELPTTRDERKAGVP